MCWFISLQNGLYQRRTKWRQNKTFETNIDVANELNADDIHRDKTSPHKTSNANGKNKNFILFLSFSFAWNSMDNGMYW